MTETIIHIILIIAAIYLLSGILFGIVFISKGISALDEGTHGTGIGFRLIILPGCIMLWPVLLGKWIKAKNKKP